MFAIAFLFQKNVRDKLTPIVVDYSFDIYDTRPRNRRDVTPILNQRIPTTVKAEVSSVQIILSWFLHTCHLHRKY